MLYLNPIIYFSLNVIVFSNFGYKLILSKIQLSDSKLSNFLFCHNLFFNLPILGPLMEETPLILFHFSYSNIISRE